MFLSLVQGTLDGQARGLDLLTLLVPERKGKKEIHLLRIHTYILVGPDHLSQSTPQEFVHVYIHAYILT